jgi:ribose-phosphate pyrophosphokinase
MLILTIPIINVKVNNGMKDLYKEKFVARNADDVLFVACNSAINLASRIKGRYEELYHATSGEKVDMPVIGTWEDPLTRVFSDTESCPRIPICIKGKEAFIFQNAHHHIGTVNENLQQLLQMIRTIKVHGATKVNVIVPYTPYSRQDKPSFMKREATLAKLFVDQLRVSGCDTFVTYHPHTLSLYGLFEPEITFIPIGGFKYFKYAFKKYKGSKSTIAVSTDAGGAKAIQHFATKLEIDYAIGNKFRSDNKVDALGVIGNLKGKERVIIIDDESATGSSIYNIVKLLHDNYGIKSFGVGLSHLKLNDTGFEKFKEMHERYGLEEVYCTDSVKSRDSEILKYDFIKVQKLDYTLAMVVNSIINKQSLSSIFD